MTKRTERLAARLEANAKALADFAAGLTPEQWRTPMPHDGRTMGVIVRVGITRPIADRRDVKPPRHAEVHDQRFA